MSKVVQLSECAIFQDGCHLLNEIHWKVFTPFLKKNCTPKNFVPRKTAPEGSDPYYATGSAILETTDSKKIELIYNSKE